VRAFLASLFVFAAAGLLYAASVTDNQQDPAKPPGRMEIFGVGPELFDNRACAWVDALANVSDKTVARLGALAIAIGLAIQNFKLKTGVKDRLDKQRADIDHVSAVAGTVPPSQVPIPPSIP
jgi:hypothetical protein